MNKLPYIPNKRLYAAVMGACSYIRETGWFNKATEYYADKYDVDLMDVQKYVRMAQSAGRKAKNTKRKYYWFAIEYSYGNEHLSTDYFIKEYADYTVIKASNKSNALHRIFLTEDPSEYGCKCHIGRIEQFDKVADAVECAKGWAEE